MNNIKFEINKKFDAEFFKDCLLLVEGDSDKVCYFYDKIFSEEDYLKKYNFTQKDFKDVSGGIFTTISKILDNPICVSYRQIFLRDKKIIFWEATSQLVYYPAIDEYHKLIREKINFEQTDNPIKIISYFE